MLNCHDVTKLFSEAQERKLTFRERIGLKVHTAMCEGCHNFGHQMQVLRQITHAYAQGASELSANEPDLPPELKR